MSIVQLCLGRIGLSRGSFRADAFALMAGTLVSQIIALAAMPLLTRLYLPSDFGVFATFTAVVSVLAVISTGRFELALVLPAEEGDAQHILLLSVAICLIVSAFTYVGFELLSPLIPTRIQWASNLGRMSLLLSVSVFIAGNYQIFTYYSSRRKQYSEIAASRIAFSVVSAGLGWLLGILGVGAVGLIYSALFAQCLALVILFLKSDVRLLGKITGFISLGKLKRNAVKYKDFPMINSWHALMDMIHSGGTVFVVSYFFGSHVLGLYSLTIRVLRAPLGLIGAAVSQTFYQRASALYNEGGDIHLFAFNTLVKLGVVSLLIFIPVFVFAPYAFGYIFGDEWVLAGDYVRILTPWLLLNFVISPISQLPIILRKQLAGFKASLFCQVSTFGVLLLTGFMGKGISLSLILFSLVGTCSLLLYGFWVMRLVRNHRMGLASVA